MLIGLRTKEGDRLAVRRCGAPGITKVVPHDGFGRPRMAQGLSVVSGRDLDLPAADPARGCDDDIGAEHAADSERVDRAERMKLAAVQAHAMFGRLRGERISVANAVSRRVGAEQVAPLKFGNDLAKL